MTTLRELHIKRKSQLENRNGTEALHQRIEKMTQMTGQMKLIAAERIKGYIEALYDNQLMTLTDANDWKHIVENKAKGLH